MLKLFVWYPTHMELKRKHDAALLRETQYIQKQADSQTEYNTLQETYDRLVSEHVTLEGKYARLQQDYTALQIPPAHQSAAIPERPTMPKPPTTRKKAAQEASEQ